LDCLVAYPFDQQTSVVAYALPALHKPFFFLVVRLDARSTHESTLRKA
jgi:hypothetical protein